MIREALLVLLAGVLLFGGLWLIATTHNTAYAALMVAGTAVAAASGLPRSRDWLARRSAGRAR